MFVIIYQIEKLLIDRWSVIRTTTKFLNKNIKTTTTTKEKQKQN
jgi:hypothetical protein